jgi:hypothetical protein
MQAVGVDNSTKLSPFLALGCISPRQVGCLCSPLAPIPSPAAARPRLSLLPSPTMPRAIATADQPLTVGGVQVHAEVLQLLQGDTPADSGAAAADGHWLIMHLCIRWGLLGCCSSEWPLVHHAPVHQVGAAWLKHDWLSSLHLCLLQFSCHILWFWGGGQWRVLSLRSVVMSSLIHTLLARACACVVSCPAACPCTRWQGLLHLLGHEGGQVPAHHSRHPGHAHPLGAGPGAAAALGAGQVGARGDPRGRAASMGASTPCAARLLLLQLLPMRSHAKPVQCMLHCTAPHRAAGRGCPLWTPACVSWRTRAG